MLRVKDSSLDFKGCTMEFLDDLMLVIRSAHDFMQKRHDEEFANENITRVIKIALATDDEEFNGSRKKYIEEMSKSLCKDCDNCGKANPLKGLFDFLDGISEKAEDDDGSEIECEVTVIKAETPEEVLAALNDIAGKSQKKAGEE